MGMYKQVVKDKAQIETTIAKLVGYKVEALKNTWEIVNAYVSTLTYIPRSILINLVSTQRIR